MNNYRAALSNQQAAALHLYRAVRRDPTPEGRRLLDLCAQLLRELTHACGPRQQWPTVVCRLDEWGRVERLSP